MNWKFSTLLAVIAFATVACEKSHEKNVSQPPSPTATQGSGQAQGATPESTQKSESKVVDPKTTEAKTTEAKTAVAKVATPPVAAKRLEGVIARVNGSIIDSKSFYAEVDRISRRNPRIPADRLARIENNILTRLIDRELVNQAIEKEGIEVTEAELKASFKEYKKRFQSDEQFENYLKHGKITVDTITKRLRDKRSLEKLIEAKGELKVTAKEATVFYDKNIKFYTEQAKVKASHILLKLPPNATAEQEKSVLTKIKKLASRLKKGDDFATLAKEFSEGPSKTKGGDLGYFGRKQMLKPFSDKAFDMKKGQTSGPVKTRYGYHLIRVYDSKLERKKPFAEVEEQISKSLRNKKYYKERRRLLQVLKEGAKIVSNLPDPPKPTFRPGGGHPAPTGATRPPVHGPGAAHKKPALDGHRHRAVRDPHAGIPGAPKLQPRPFPRKGQKGLKVIPALHRAPKAVK